MEHTVQVTARLPMPKYSQPLPVRPYGPHSLSEVNVWVSRLHKTILSCMLMIVLHKMRVKGALFPIDAILFYIRLSCPVMLDTNLR